VQPIAGYLYRQSVTVIKNSDFEPLRENQQVYAKPLQFYKGIDNRFQLVIRNADQKQVSLLDNVVVFNLIDATTSEIIISRRLDLVYSSRGVATTVLQRDLLNNISAGLYNYALYVIDGEGEQQIIYSDDHYQSLGRARIHDGVYPTFRASIQPKILAYSNSSDTNYKTVAFTDVINLTDRVTNNTIMQTVQYQVSEFTGYVEAQATQDAMPGNSEAMWFPVYTAICTAKTGTDYFVLQGKFSGVRFKITKTTGDVNYILYRS
jgi:hypothetical protein